MKKLGLVLGLMVGAVAPAREAAAFCRSTTCSGEDCTRDENGCKTSGQKLFWPTSCVGISLQRDSSVHIAFKYFEQVAQRSMLSWTGLECADGAATIGFSQLDEVSCNETEYNTSGTNTNVILFQDTKWIYKGVDNTLAKTTVTFNDDTGEILDADIEINHANNNFTISDMVIEYDLEAVLTHELGHLIGLDHTPDFDATMFAGYEPGTIDQRTLEEDDLLAACDAYPGMRTATCDPEPRGGLGDLCGGEGNPVDEQGVSGCASSGLGSAASLSGWGALLCGASLVLGRRRRTSGVSHDKDSA
jgi:hypothetical protein